MHNETAESIIIELIEHYVYIFGAPKTIMTNQGQNFLLELMQQLEEALNIQHDKTTAFHPQSEGDIERMHSTLKNLMKTSVEQNRMLSQKF